MNSINANQPEDTHQNLSGKAAIHRVQEMIKNVSTCFFCTTPASSGSGIRPMTVQTVDDDGSLWFLSARDSTENKELAADPSVKLFFQGSAYSDFLHLAGRGTISTDQAKIKELWKPMLKTWFTGGVEDPRITVIKVVPSEGYYWDNKHGNAVAGIKVLIGAVIGKTLDDSIEGQAEALVLAQGPPNRPGWFAGRGPRGQWNCLSVASIRTSLMLASRRRMSPSPSNSQSSFP